MILLRNIWYKTEPGNIVHLSAAATCLRKAEECAIVFTVVEADD